MMVLVWMFALSFAGKQEPFSPSSVVKLRSSFDQDPSTYLGRFLKSGTTEVDESAAMTLACSPFISHRFVSTGNVTFDELMEVSSGAAARFSIPLIAKGSGKAASEKYTRVQYTLTGKLIGEITDPAGFAKCCQEQPSQCTDRYVGEFLQGTGRIFKVVASKKGASADGGFSGSSAELSAFQDRSWEQSIVFKEPVFFAYKLSQTPQTREVSACGDWVNRPPSSDQGLVVVGSSNKPMKTEQKAKEQARKDAMIQGFNTGLGRNGLDLVMSQIRTSRSNRYRMLSKMAHVPHEVREWCVERADNGRYTAKALVFFPKQQFPLGFPQPRSLPMLAPQAN